MAIKQPLEFFNIPVHIILLVMKRPHLSLKHTYTRAKLVNYFNEHRNELANLPPNIAHQHWKVWTNRLSMLFLHDMESRGCSRPWFSVTLLSVCSLLKSIKKKCGEERLDRNYNLAYDASPVRNRVQTFHTWANIANIFLCFDHMPTLPWWWLVSVFKPQNCQYFNVHKQEFFFFSSSVKQQTLHWVLLFTLFVTGQLSLSPFSSLNTTWLQGKLSIF